MRPEEIPKSFLEIPLALRRKIYAEEPYFYAKFQLYIAICRELPSYRPPSLFLKGVPEGQTPVRGPADTSSVTSRRSVSQNC